jgi:hypothetical protein
MESWIMNRIEAGFFVTAIGLPSFETIGRHCARALRQYGRIAAITWLTMLL